MKNPIAAISTTVTQFVTFHAKMFSFMGETSSVKETYCNVGVPPLIQAHKVLIVKEKVASWVVKYFYDLVYFLRLQRNKTTFVFRNFFQGFGWFQFLSECRVN